MFRKMNRRFILVSRSVNVNASRLKTSWGPNTHFRRGTYVVGTNPHPLKYYFPFFKKPHQPYGLQDNNHLLPGKGLVKARMPCKVRLEKDRIYLWCSCGHSNNQPFCDGSHNREDTKLGPVRYVPEKDEDVWLCCCKQTENRPFCDGSHKNLPEETVDEEEERFRWRR